MTSVRDQLGLGGAPAPPEPPGEESEQPELDYDPLGAAVEGLMSAVEVMATAHDAVLRAVGHVQQCLAFHRGGAAKLAQLQTQLEVAEQNQRAMELDLNRAAAEIAATKGQLPSPIAGKLPTEQAEDCDHPPSVVVEIPTMGDSRQYMCQACGTAVEPDVDTPEPEWVTVPPFVEGGE